MANPAVDIAVQIPNPAPIESDHVVDFPRQRSSARRRVVRGWASRFTAGVRAAHEAKVPF